MIYKKLNYTPLTHNRYEQEWEYMFCFSKGKPKIFNPIKIPTKYGGTETWGKPAYYKTADGTLTAKPKSVIRDTKIKGNIFEYRTGSTKTGKIKHPAMFPEQLAIDQILSWTNEGDIVFDPFMGSGTTAVASLKNNRNYIGFEISSEYCDMANTRLKELKSINGSKQDIQ
jgi:site-specific DNA-methyltransferase (adenine-specific)